jgi:hypothetical protein
LAEVLATGTLGCGAATSLAAVVGDSTDARAPLDAPAETTSRDAASTHPANSCGFTLTGGIDASATAGVPVAYPSGAEIPFLLFECSGTTGSISYLLGGQYVAGGMNTSVFLAWNSTETMDLSSCTSTTVFDGLPTLDGSVPFDAGEDGPSGFVGHELSISMECPNALTLADGGIVTLTNGWINTVITAGPK